MNSHRKTLDEEMIEVDARQLQEGLYGYGLVPHRFLRREAELRQVCLEVARDWLRGDIASPLYKDVLWEVYFRLRAKEDSEDTRESHSDP